MNDESMSTKKLNFVTCASCFGFATMLVVWVVLALCTVSTEHKFYKLFITDWKSLQHKKPLPCPLSWPLSLKAAFLDGFITFFRRQ